VVPLSVPKRQNARMARSWTFRPVHGVLAVAALLAAFLSLEAAFGSGSRATRVAPDPQGRVTLDVADLKPLEVRFYRFLNSGNQEVKFFVGRDESGALQVAFDASENDFKRKRGFRAEGAWMVNNKCDTAVRLAEVNAAPSGCAPTPLRFRQEGTRILLAENDVLEGWRYFR
jgi:uncharacterized membrane protein